VVALSLRCALLPLFLLLAACSSGAQQPSDTPVVTDLRDPSINTSVYNCVRADESTFEFTVRRGPAEMALWLPFDFGYPYLVLSSDGSSDATLYREGDVSIVIGDASAELVVGDLRFPDCAYNALRSEWEHAKLTGVDYRASGDDGDWILEIRNADTIRFVDRSDGTELRFPTPEPHSDAARRVTTWSADGDGSTIEITVSGLQCGAPDRDDMTGTSVTVILGDRLLTGCGRALH